MSADLGIVLVLLAVAVAMFVIGRPRMDAVALIMIAALPLTGIVTVSPGKGGLGTFAPPLDGAGNSVKGQLVARFLSQRLGMDLFVSQPAA